MKFLVKILLEGCSSEFRSIVAAAKEQGWRVELTRASHWRFVSPDVSVPVHVTCSSPGNSLRFIKRLRQELRRKGLQL
jgi:predicted RNA binding protein YcfA (HicA-like mRNA interferase family)